MTKQEKIREGVASWLTQYFAYSWQQLNEGQRQQKLDEAQSLMTYLHSQGVVIKAKEQSPGITNRRNKSISVRYFRDVMNKCVRNIDGAERPVVLFFVGDDEYDLDRIGQYGIMPDVTINLKSKAGCGFLEPLIKEEK